MNHLHVVKLDPRATLPTVATPGEDLGYDLYALEDTYVAPGQVSLIRTGISATAYKHVGYSENPYSRVRVGMLYRDRSSMAKRGFLTLGGVIDAGYTGELAVMMTNVVRDDVIKAGEKIVQMIPTEVLTGYVHEVEQLEESKRGEKGFGSSGR